MNPAFGIIILGSIILILIDSLLGSIVGALLCLSGIAIYFLYENHRRLKIFAPLNFKRATEGFTTKEKWTCALFFPVILIMWYGFYMWKDAYGSANKW